MFLGVVRFHRVAVGQLPDERVAAVRLEVDEGDEFHVGVGLEPADVAVADREVVLGHVAVGRLVVGDDERAVVRVRLARALVEPVDAGLVADGADAEPGALDPPEAGQRVAEVAERAVGLDVDQPASEPRKQAARRPSLAREPRRVVCVPLVVGQRVA